LWRIIGIIIVLMISIVGSMYIANVSIEKELNMFQWGLERFSRFMNISTGAIITGVLGIGIVLVVNEHDKLY